MLPLALSDIPELYAGFDAPIAELDCGEKCAPYNGGAPFCCDTCHTVPTAYKVEWDYLQASTDLWHRWQASEPAETIRLTKEAGPDLILIECLGHERCQRAFRSIVCRSFPFFPYFDSHGTFLGMSYYWEYADRCWVISNLQIVSEPYRTQFIHTFEQLFEYLPEEREAFAYTSAEIRRFFLEEGNAVPLLHRDGKAYQIDPHTEQKRTVQPGSFPKYDPYKITDSLLFPDELELFSAEE